VQAAVRRVYAEDSWRLELPFSLESKSFLDGGDAVSQREHACDVRAREQQRPWCLHE
jgi:hypothetical protein